MNSSANLGSRRFPEPGRRSCFPLRPSVSSVVGLFAVCLFVAIFGCTIGGQSKHPNWKNATGAEQYERLMWQAIRDKDWKEVEYRLAPSFTGVNARGQMLDRAGWVTYWKTAPITDFSLGEVQVQPNGPDMTVTYVLHLGGTPAAGLRVVSLWQQVKGGWILIATSNTAISAN
jgi:Domain of unknown function (DUF4440)